MVQSTSRKLYVGIPVYLEECFPNFRPWTSPLKKFSYPKKPLRMKTFRGQKKRGS